MGLPAHEPTWAFLRAPRCGARNRRGLPCQGPAVHGKRRCKFHGGMSTGARTPEGLARIREANTTHGFYTKAAKQARAEARHLARQFRALLASLE